MNKITIEEYREMEDSFMGWCPHCKEFTRDTTEADAENYDCPECGENDVMGVMNAMMTGAVVVTGGAE